MWGASALGKVEGKTIQTHMGHETVFEKSRLGYGLIAMSVTVIDPQVYPLLKIVIR